MPLVKRLTRVGNCSGVVIDRAILRQLGLEPEGEVELRVERDTLVISPHRYANPAEFQAATDRVFTRRRKLMERLARR